MLAKFTPRLSTKLKWKKLLRLAGYQLALFCLTGTAVYFLIPWLQNDKDATVQTELIKQKLPCCDLRPDEHGHVTLCLRPDTYDMIDKEWTLRAKNKQTIYLRQTSTPQVPFPRHLVLTGKLLLQNNKLIIIPTHEL